MTSLARRAGWRWWGVLALFSLALAIWFLGPLVNVGTAQPLSSPEVRGAAVVVVLLVAVILMGSALKAGAAGERLLAALRSTLFAALRSTALINTLFAVATIGSLIGLWMLDNEAKRKIAEISVGVNEAAVVLEEIAPDSATILDILPALELLRTLPWGFEDVTNNPPDMFDLVLLQRGKLQRAATAAYQRALNSRLLPLVMNHMEAELRNPGGVATEYLPEWLQAYLMLGNADKFIPEFLTAFLDLVWISNLSVEVTPAQRAAFLSHIDVLFSTRPASLPWALNDGLITSARAKVALLPAEERLYRRLRVVSAADAAPFSIVERAGPRAQLVFTRRSGASLTEGVPGFFTREYYENQFASLASELMREQLDERWILGETSSGEFNETTVLDNVRSLYFADYAQSYEKLLDDLELAPFSDATQAAERLAILADNSSSPLLRLFHAVAEETALDLTRREQTRPRAITQATLSKFQSPRSPAIDHSATDGGINPVTQRFEWLRDLVWASDGERARIEPIMQIFEDLHGFTAQFSRDMSVEQAATGQGQFLAMRLQADRQPPMVGQLINEAVSQTESLTYGAALNATWRAEGLDFCNRAISNRYPLQRSARQDMSLADFARFFGHGGIADRFVEESLSHYVDTSSRPWRMLNASENSWRVRAEALRQFEIAQDIRDTYFESKDNRPLVSFALSFSEMDAKAKRFVLNVGGQSLSYNHGPSLQKYLDWPGPEPDAGVRVQVDKSRPIQEPGPWGLFRLLDRATITPTIDKGLSRITLEIGIRVSFDLRAKDDAMPFSGDLLSRFTCPTLL